MELGRENPAFRVKNGLMIISQQHARENRLVRLSQHEL
jgi:hypothetical protein